MPLVTEAPTLLPDATSADDWSDTTATLNRHGSAVLSQSQDIVHMNSIEIGSLSPAAETPDMLAELHACLADQRSHRLETVYCNSTTSQERHLDISYVFVPPSTVMLHTEDVTDAKQAEQRRDAPEHSCHCA